MSATLDPAPEIVTTPCRVCGEPIGASVARCARCGTSRVRREHTTAEMTWVDIVLATLSGLVALSVAAPITFALLSEIWRGTFVWNDVPLTLTISTFNVGLIGLPIVVTLWRWRERAWDGGPQHGSALREYWQSQMLCLLPFAVIGLFVGTFWIIATYFSG